MTMRQPPFRLRMPDSLKDWCYALSKKNRRSASSEIMFILRESLSKEYYPDAIKLFKHKSPPSNNGEGYGIRFDLELKEALKNLAKTNGNSLNQEMVMRLYFAEKEAQASGPMLTVVKNHMAKEATIEYNVEDNSIIKLLNSLTDKNKQAVLNLIRNLSD